MIKNTKNRVFIIFIIVRKICYIYKQWVALLLLIRLLVGLSFLFFFFGLVLYVFGIPFTSLRFNIRPHMCAEWYMSDAPTKFRLSRGHKNSCCHPQESDGVLHSGKCQKDGSVLNTHAQIHTNKVMHKLNNI